MPPRQQRHSPKNPSKASLSLGARVRALRLRADLTLDELARRSGISKAMLSKIENNLTQPTVTRIGRLAESLDVTITQLIGGRERRHILHLPKAAQAVIRDSRSGYIRRSLSPLFPSRGIDFVEGRLRKGASTGSFVPHAHGVEEMLVVSQGRIRVILDDASYELEEGDSIYFEADVEHQFDNIGTDEAIFFLVINGSHAH